MQGIEFFDLPGPWAGIGSREAPMPVLVLMARYARTVYELGLGPLYSGDAIGSDFAVWVGAVLSGGPNFSRNKPKIFLSRNGYQNRWHDSNLGFINVKAYGRERWEEANQIALEARKGFWGLGKGGIELVTRNAFQLLDEDLKHPVAKCLYWGIPQGKTEKVKGGTNVGLQIAIRFGIPRMNLYYEENQRLLEAWLAEKESKVPYPSPYENITLEGIIDSRRNDYPFPGF
ncbi:DprA-like DNA recombination-mediator protein [Pseudomonas phage Noxifer]|uniref:Uncharacterized protein n=1 Tax=Pseudomonas phage Noxifer TaxID=2006684 RepID=A0A1Y0T1I0_9CAUD|nr:DprA-like DNA recombination-mediator protein [Pseudomonas phage Noxifer]ARV77398.1 hypothetical protein NOXIFER_233 [Pseudomonas phage Noxifer]